MRGDEGKRAVSGMREMSLNSSGRLGQSLN